MTSEAIRDPKADHLLTPQNSAFIIIDYQPVQVNSIASMDRQLLLNNIAGCARAAVAYDLPIVHSTVNVETGLNKPPVPQVRKVLGDYAELGKGWTEKTALQFKSSLDLHAVPSLGRKRVGDIETSHILGALAPIWTTKPQIARKVRHRILQVLAFAKSNGWRSASVPEIADLSRGLAKQPKSKGYAALPFRDVPKFFASERGKEASPARLALMFTILTAARSGEVRKASWIEIDLQAREWRRPGSTMKSGEPHVVMLSHHAIAVLKLARDRFGDDGLIFPSLHGLMLTDMSLSKMMKLAGRPETVHGFRSSFRDWAAEEMPHVPAMVPEMALAHSVGTAVEKAYLRSDLKALRLQLMAEWGAFVMSGSATASCGHKSRLSTG